MEQTKVSQDNFLFFCSAVGMALGIINFAQVVLESSLEVTHLPTDIFGKPGYIKVNSSEIRAKGEEFWHEFTDKVRNRLLHKVSFCFGSDMSFEGDLCEKVIVERDGYVFSFHIKEYERDKAHNFKIVSFEDLDGIPEDEELGRVVYLTIMLAD